MNNLAYLFSTGLVLLIFTAYYFLFLKQSKNFLFNRIYLVTTGLFSFIINMPGLSVVSGRELISYTLQTFEVSSLNSIYTLADIPVSFSGIVWAVYFTGVSVLILINGIAWYKIKAIIRKGNITTLYGREVIVNDRIDDSFSFMNFIVVPCNSVSSFVVQHEKAHVKGMHAIDLFFAELVCTVLWFVPYIRCYKKAVVLNHEFIADNISGTSFSRDAYCKQLLAQTIGVPEFSLGHTFSHPSLTKTRIKMMYKNPMSKMQTIAGSLLFIPVLMIAVFVSSCKDDMQNTPDNSVNKIIAGQSEVQPEFPGGSEALIAYLSSNITYPESAKNSKTEGKVFIQFVVTSNGKVTDVTIAKGVNRDLDTEAARVITSMPDWKPGTKNGKPVSMQMTIPIMFALK